MVSALVLALAATTFAQTNLQFTAATVTDEQAIRLSWASTDHEVYQIQCADALATNADGSTAWQILCDNYPSQGTNTFWLDTGDYLLHVPPIVHPKYAPMRFYRILDKGVDDLVSDEPAVSIISPTNGFVATGDLTITVAASTDQSGGMNTKLYVDGQEMWPSDDGTNYVINTCEWGNGAHTLFATAVAYSQLNSSINSGPTLVGHGVSPFVQVVFSNLVTRISFSQPFFNPDAGQTQQVSAVFAANSDWTLNIVDRSTNIVKTATGSGTSMLYNWDGTDDSNNPVNAGVYYYLISAQTNGESSERMMNESMATSSFASDDSSQWYVTPIDGSGGITPLALYPPGTIDTNNYYLFQASPSDVRPQRSSSMAMHSSFSADSSSSSDSPSSQDASAAPARPPTAPMARVAGTFGIAYQTYSAVGSGYYQPASPQQYNTPNLGHITIDGYGSGNPPKYYALTDADFEALQFAAEMEKGGWSPGLTKHDDTLTIGDLRGSGTPFNQVNIGFLVIHGATGDTMDYTASGCKQMYFPIAAGTSSQYLRMSEMNFGGAGTNGLKWMVLATCRSLQHDNWSSMQSQNIHPYNSNLHLLLGVDTDLTIEPRIGQKFAHYILVGKDSGPMKIRDAWYQAARDAYADALKFGFTPTVNPIKFIVAGDSNCFNDTVQTNYPPQGSWTTDMPTQVYP